MRPDARPAAGLSVVVLGGTGFLGRHIGEAFTALGARVLPVSRTGGYDSAQDRTPVRLDLLAAAPEEIAGLLDSTGADVVVNAAGRAWRADEEQMAAGNAELVERLVAALAGLPGPPVRLVQLGTVHEYGAGALDAATNEDHTPAPVTAYGRTKLLGARAVLRAASERGVDGVVLRLANVIGAGVPEGSLFGRVAAHLGEAARAHARGEKAAELRLPPLRVARDLVDAADAVAAVLAAATAPGAAVTGRVINVGRGEAVPMRRLIHRMVSLSGLEVPVVEDPERPPSRTDVAWQRLDIARAERLLGWRPRRSLDDSLRDLLAPVLPPGHPPLGITANAPDMEEESP
ncbi:NAD-dependent epimerase/dehydratase family protein [Streptomyces sp. NBC_00576]|uniref:NAD-dependent epimerase/dehydratase family protein n=1 Tax=Streptomyces sp. NBC_00576 TaxID=2903665 RepID=UPI002E817793|nr:NAD(P)-dependent oxidoreductase [Streptomyces sp. NBC_00576]WUB73466.1 NAD(P)-dependent oxidoreductase [Streptomyces sp. NBC_00576]